MVNRNILVGALAAAATGVVAQESNNIRFGNALSLGATNSYIVEAETTLYPGETQSGDTPRMALWPGMGTDESQLIQAIVLESTDAQGEDCGGAAHVQGQWCAFASALQDDVQLQGDTFAVTSKQGVKIHCMFPTLEKDIDVTNTHDRQVRRVLGQHNPNRQRRWKDRLDTQNQVRQANRLGYRRRSPSRLQGHRERTQ